MEPLLLFSINQQSELWHHFIVPLLFATWIFFFSDLCIDNCRSCRKLASHSHVDVTLSQDPVEAAHIQLLFQASESYWQVFEELKCLKVKQHTPTKKTKQKNKHKGCHRRPIFHAFTWHFHSRQGLLLLSLRDNFYIQQKITETIQNTL